MRNLPPAQGGIQILGRAEARGRLCDHAAPVPTVRRLRGGASASVHRHYGGFPVASQRQGCTVQTVQKTVDFLLVQLLDKVDMPVVVQRQVRGFDSAENSGSTAMQYLDRVVDVPAAVHRQGLDVPVISQRCLRFSSSLELGYDGSGWIFGAFCAIFRAPPVFRS